MAACERRAGRVFRARCARRASSGAALLGAFWLACADEPSPAGEAMKSAGLAGAAGDTANGSAGPITLDAGARALCGGLGEPCCAAPLPLCGADFDCDESERCATQQGSGQRSRLCTEQGECNPGEICCPLGAFGVCSSVEQVAGCPRPDLAVRLDPLIELESRRFSSGECEVGCGLPAGDRRLLRIAPTIVNLGDGDAIVGTANSPGIEEECGGMYLAGALRYELLGEAGSAVGDGHLRPGGVSNGPRRLGGSLLGLSPGFSDANAAGCRWLDISGLSPGVYTLRVTLALDPRMPDSDPSNDRVETLVDLSGALLEPCGPNHPGAYQAFGERDCGWAAAGAGTCTPGETVFAACSTCSGSLNLRACAGSEPCAFGSSALLSSSSSFGFFGECPGLTFTCPDSGTYLSLSGTSDGSEYACDLQPLAPVSDPLVACGLVDQLLTSTERDCGWAPASSATCVPGERVEVGCPACTGDPILRVCEGSGDCLFSSPANLGSVDDSIGLCPTLGFECPASGTYASLVSAYSVPPDPGTTCDVAVLENAVGGE